ncbi:nrv2 [Trypoxylus dichotomus]
MHQSKLRARVDKMSRFIHDKERKTYCNKSVLSWKRVWIVYSAYFWSVMLVFGIMLYAINSQAVKHGINAQFDKMTMILNNTPQLSIIPKLPNSHMLWYTDEANNSEIITADYYIKYLDEFFKPYENPDPHIYVDCSNPNVVTRGKLCKFTKSMLGPCGEDGYGYKDGKPCIFLKLNNMRGWDPWAVGEREITGSEGEIEGEEEEFDLNSRVNQTLTAECTPGTSFGCERLGYMGHYPSNSFPSYFFPYNGSELYLAPLIAVQFADIVRGFVVMVTCSAWGIPMTQTVREMLSATVFLYINEGEEQRR